MLIFKIMLFFLIITLIIIFIASITKKNNKKEKNKATKNQNILIFGLNIVTIIIPLYYLYNTLNIRVMEKGGGGNALGTWLDIILGVPSLLIIILLLFFISKYFNKFKNKVPITQYTLIRNFIIFFISLLIITISI